MDLVGLAPSFGGLIFTILAFIVALSVIVFIHEYGHYIVGRWTGIGADVFSVGFGPVIWSRKDKRGTQWQVAALPFGGYVKFKGDANAASAPDGEASVGLTPEELRATMHGAPVWARALTVLAGPVFNFILSILIFAGFLLWIGSPREQLTVGEIAEIPAEVQELKTGDEVLAIAGIETPPNAELGDLLDTLPDEPTLDYLVRRDGEEITVRAPYPQAALVSGVQPQSAAMDAGLQVGDVIQVINGTDVRSFSHMIDLVASAEGTPLDLKVWRAGEILEMTLTPRQTDLPKEDGTFETRWLIGISGNMFFSPATESAGLWESVKYGADQTYFVVRSSLSGLYHVIAGKISTCNIKGPISIASASGDMARQGLSNFIWFIAALSTAVGLINLFPIPVLDGGHLVFHAYEAITGRPPSENAMKYLMIVGLSLMGMLMVFALTNDLFC
jgi:regulator of sigma E protease